VNRFCRGLLVIDDVDNLVAVLLNGGGVINLVLDTKRMPEKVFRAAGSAIDVVRAGCSDDSIARENKSQFSRELAALNVISKR
jgi:hypothetical protein